MNAVQVYPPSTSAMKLSSSDNLLRDLVSIVDDAVWSDIQIKVQDKSFGCHKNILAARSSYFNERLLSDRPLTEIVEENGNVDAFELVRRYIYTGTFTHEEANEELIANVLSLSIKYKLEELTNFLSDRMKERITAANAVVLFRLTSDIEMICLADECLKFIRTHGNECLEGESYFDLNLNQLVQVVKNASLGDKTQLIIRKWNKRHPDVSATKLFEMMDGVSDEGDDGQIVETDEKQYVLLHGFTGKMVILDAATFDHVSPRDEPTTNLCLIAVCKGILYSIDTQKGEIRSTRVASVLKSESIQWDKCADFQSSGWIPGNAAVTGSVICFMDKIHLWKFDTNSNTVTKCCDYGGGFAFYSLIELNGLIYCHKDDKLQFTDGTNGWTQIVVPTSPVHRPHDCSLIKMQDTICLVGGKSRTGAFLNSVLCYDTKLSSWRKRNPVNLPRSRAGTVSLDGGKALFVGGFNWQWMNTIELFDEQTNEWTLIDYGAEVEYPQAITFYA